MMEPGWILEVWAQVRAGLLQILEKFDNSALTFSPFDASWPAGQIMLHIAGAEEGWFRHVVTRELPEWPADFNLQRHASVDSIVETLSAVHVRTRIYLQGLKGNDLESLVALPWGGEWSIGAIAWHVLEHEIHHRGELSLILGMIGSDGLEV